MTDTGAAAAPAKASKPKVVRAKPTHPPTVEMVQGAIKGLKERGGSSLIAIKKYIAANYKVDVEKLAPFIKRALKSGVTAGSLVQTKGKGASGSFKLSAAAPKKAATTAKKVAKSPAKAKKPAAAKKPTKAKKAPAKSPAKAKKAKSPAKAKKPAAAKKPSKAKKTTKSPAKKPKAPKAKKSPAKKAAKK